MEFKLWLESSQDINNMLASMLADPKEWRNPAGWSVLADALEEIGDTSSELFRNHPIFQYAYTTYQANGIVPIRVLNQLELAKQTDTARPYVAEQSKCNFAELLKICWTHRWYHWKLEVQPNLILLRTVPEKEHGFWGWATMKFSSQVPITEASKNIITQALGKIIDSKPMPSYWQSK